MWRGRWASSRMLEHHVQELMAMETLVSLPSTRRQLIGHLESLFEAIVIEV